MAIIDGSNRGNILTYEKGDDIDKVGLDPKRFAKEHGGINEAKTKRGSTSGSIVYNDGTEYVYGQGEHNNIEQVWTKETRAAYDRMLHGDKPHKAPKQDAQLHAKLDGAIDDLALKDLMARGAERISRETPRSAAESGADFDMALIHNKATGIKAVAAQAAERVAKQEVSTDAVTGDASFQVAHNGVGNASQRKKAIDAVDAALKGVKLDTVVASADASLSVAELMKPSHDAGHGTKATTKGRDLLA